MDELHESMVETAAVRARSQSPCCKHRTDACNATKADEHAVS
jgi:hypothetical protein